MAVQKNTTRPCAAATFRADIDYAWKEALTVYGKIGIKVWICKGEVFGKRDLSPNVGTSRNVSASVRPWWLLNVDNKEQKQYRYSQKSKASPRPTKAA